MFALVYWHDNAPIVPNSLQQEVFQAVRALGFRVLVTTRKEAVIPTSPGWRVIVVPRMDEASSLCVLQNCSGAASALPRESALEVSQPDECSLNRCNSRIGGFVVTGWAFVMEIKFEEYPGPRRLRIRLPKLVRFIR